MRDLLIGLAVLGGMALLVYAVVREGRRQRERRREPFRKLAERRGWEYLQEDDGRVAAAGISFEAFGVFSSPSLGKVKPQNVVSGTTEEGDILVFWHFRRFNEGQASPFYVALIDTGRPLADRLVIRKGARKRGGNAFYAGEPVALETEGVALQVFSGGANESGAALNPALGRRLAKILGDVPWPVDLQVRGPRVALYTWKELDLDGVTELERLVESALEATRALLELPA